jgi:imidazolonepropionase
MIADFIIRNAGALITCAGPAPRAGVRQDDVRVLAGGSVAALNGAIVFAGRDAELDPQVMSPSGAVVLDAEGCTVVPGFVDAHTHLVYAGNRQDELRRRLSGATYAQLAAEGGGILGTVRATREASEEQLVAESRERLDEALRCGTTTCEVKSGYGLDTATEIKMLHAIRQLDSTHPIDLVATFLGAHEVPPEYRARRRDYVDLVVGDMIPRVAEARLAAWCDVFCEEGVFAPGESREILEAGRRFGLQPRIHADELAPSGGTAVASAVRARSADHLIFVDEAGARALAASGTIATLLPAATFYLKLGRFAPARMLIEQQVPVALGSDINPGGGFSPSLPFAMTLGCFAMGLTLEEALVAVTINAACALDCEELVGSLEPGKLMDAVLIRGDVTTLLRVGIDAIEGVVKRGRLVFDRHGRWTSQDAPRVHEQG